MARGFGATLGVGATDKMASALTTYPAQRSYFIRANRNGDGGASLGRMFDQASGVLLNVGVTTYTFQVQFSGALAAWSLTRPSTGVWKSYGIRYDNGSTANDPVIFEDTTKLVVLGGLTENTSPSGTRTDVAGSVINVGNRAASDRGWDGSLADFAIWDALLDDDEFIALARGYSPRLIRPASLVEFIPMVRDNLSIKIAAPAVTGTAVQPHARVIGGRR